MKKLAHYLELRVLKYPTEDSEKVETALANIIDEEREELEEEIEKKKVESQYGSEIIRYDYKTKRWSEVKELVKRIFSEITTPTNIERYLNDEGDFFVRLDKQKAYKGEIKTSESGDVIHLKVKIASYPFDMENVKKNLKELIGEE